MPDRREHHVLWHCGLLASSEYVSLSSHEGGYRLAGTAVLPVQGVPGRIDYRVGIDATWWARDTEVTVTTPERTRRIEVARRPDGTWTIDGSEAPRLAGCTDVDLGWTPATNTVPIRRLDLDIGKSGTVTAAWIRFPELDIVPSEQRYTRQAHDRWRYQSGEYDFELATNPVSGLVLAYGDDLWRAAATFTRVE